MTGLPKINFPFSIVSIVASIKWKTILGGILGTPEYGKKSEKISRSSINHSKAVWKFKNRSKTFVWNLASFILKNMYFRNPWYGKIWCTIDWNIRNRSRLSYTVSIFWQKKILKNFMVIFITRGGRGNRVIYFPMNLTNNFGKILLLFFFNFRSKIVLWFKILRRIALKSCLVFSVRGNTLVLRHNSTTPSKRVNFRKISYESRRDEFCKKALIFLKNSITINFDMNIW